MSEGPAAEIRVKVLTRDPPHILRRQFPDAQARWGRCRYLFDRASRDYDWLVVYDDLPPRAGERRSLGAEPLACPPCNTLLVTTEPSSIKAYGSDYVRQFGCVLTSQEPWALPHGDRIYSQPALRWFYGVGQDHLLGFDALANRPPPEKTADISMVWSGKQEWYTCHRLRHRFMQAARDELDALTVYGRGVRPLDDKAEALDAYRYHIAIENHIAPHHWTEKLADAFLGYALPFYFGCPNLEAYFPAQSFIRIDIHDIPAALRTIREAVAGDLYRERLPYIMEARRRILEEYNFAAVVSREIERRHADPQRTCPGGAATLYSRHALRRRRPLAALRQVYEKVRNPLLYNLKTRCRYPAQGGQG